MINPTIITSLDDAQISAAFALVGANGSLYNKYSRLYNPVTGAEFQARWTQPLLFEVAIVISPSAPNDPAYVILSIINSGTGAKIRSGKKYENGSSKAKDDYNRLFKSFGDFVFVLNDVLFDSSGPVTNTGAAQNTGANAGNQGGDPNQGGAATGITPDGGGNNGGGGQGGAGVGEITPSG